VASSLRVGDDLTLPLDWMLLATVGYGARGSGKTTFGRVMAEEVTKAGQRFCAVEPKGDFWGLKATADGRGEGIPVVVFGGDHADLPLEEGAGAYIAEAITEMDQSVVLDLEHLSKGKQLKFMAPFLERLYDKNRDPLLLIVDEAQRYAPQKPISTEATICLGAMEDIVKLGRKHGLGVLLLTQRGSGLNKEVSELCDLLVAFRTPGPLDQERIKDWLDANATREQREQVMGAIAKMPTGRAIFASGHPSLSLFQAAQVRRSETYDSSATPKIGERRTEPKRLAHPDLEVLRAKMADAIERAKAEDPKELRKQIATLRAEIAALQQRKPEQVIKQVERVVEVVPPKVVSLVVDALRAHTELQQGLGAIAKLADVAAVRTSDALAMVRDAEAQPKPPKPPREVVATDAEQSAKVLVDMVHKEVAIRYPGNGAVTYDPTVLKALGKAERAIVAALLAYPQPLTRQQLAFLAGYHPNSKGFVNALGSLRSSGYISQGFPATITDAGRALGVDPLDTGHGVEQLWLDRFGRAERSILSHLMSIYPSEEQRAELGRVAGFEHPNSKGYVNALGRLRGLGLVDGFGLSPEFAQIAGV
jgi:hypothetical protein